MNGYRNCKYKNKASLNGHHRILTESIYLKTSLLIQLVIVRTMVSACNKTYNVGIKKRPTSSFFSTSGIIGKKVCKIMNLVFNICDKNTIFVQKNNPVNMNLYHYYCNGML